MAGRSFTLGDFHAGVQNARNPFGLPLTALTDGENVELYRGLRTRKGYEVVSAGSSSPGGVAGITEIPDGAYAYFLFNGGDGSHIFTDYCGHTMEMWWPTIVEDNGIYGGYTYELDTSEKYEGSASLHSEGNTPGETWTEIMCSDASDFDFSGGEYDLTIRAYFKLATGSGDNDMCFVAQNKSGTGWEAFHCWEFTYEEDQGIFRFWDEVADNGTELNLMASCTPTKGLWWRVELRWDSATGVYTIAADEAASWTGNGTTRGSSSSGMSAPGYASGRHLSLCLVRDGRGGASTMSMWVDQLAIIWGTTPAAERWAENGIVTSEVSRLVQVRHPTTEMTYLIAQVIDGISGTSTLCACDDPLPSSTLEFSHLYSLGSGNSVISVATLGDRTIICSDEEEPLVFSGGLAPDSSAADWPHPYQVLMRPLGTDAYDISSDVLDKDDDVSHIIGGVQSGGDMLIVTEVPYVKGFYFTFDTVNTGPGAGSGTTTTRTSEFNGSGDCDIEEVKGLCIYWNQSGTVFGNFESAEQNLDNAAAVDKGGGLVGIPCTDHGYSSGHTVRIYGTTSYNGVYVLDASTSMDEMVISETFVSETFAGTEGVRLRPTLGTGNDQPRIEAGLKVTVGGSDYYIVAVTDDGEADGEVELSAEVTENPVTGIYGLVVDSCYVRTISDGTTGTSILAADLKTGLFSSVLNAAYPWSFRQVVNASDLTDVNFDQIRVKCTFSNYFLAATSTTNKYVDNASIGTQSSGADTTGTPVELKFAGESGFCVTELPATQWSDWTPFSGDGTQNLVFIMDLPVRWNEGTFTDGSGNVLAKWAPMYSFKSSATGRTCYYKENDASYDDATVTGYSSVSNYWVGIADIEVRNSFAIPTGRFVMVGTDAVEIDTATAQHVTGVTVTGTEEGTSEINHMVCFTGNRDSYWAFLGSTWYELAKYDYSLGRWRYYDTSWQDADPDSLLGALYGAFGGSSQMSTAQLEAITETQWESTGGFKANFTPSLSFAACLRSDGTNVPILQNYSVGLYDEGSANIEYYAGGTWTDGDGFTDGTLSGSTPFGQDGAVTYDGDYAEPTLATIEGVQGYYYKLVFPTGLASATSLTRVQVKYKPATLLKNLDDGFADYPSGVIVDTGSSIQDFTCEAIDDTKTDAGAVWLCDGDPDGSPAAFGTSGALYIGGPYRFNEVMIEPHRVYFNQNAATAAVYYWNGSRWAELTVTDGTASDGKTLAQKGKISWTLPNDWKIYRPIDSPDVSRAYWVKITVSADLTAPTGIYEVRLWDVPEDLPKYKYAVVANNRLFLASRPDAPSQIDISREREEFGFSGNDSASIHLGGDSITAVFAAWDNVIICQPDQMRALTFRSPSEWNLTKLQVTETPVNSRAVVHAPIGGPQSAGTTKQGLFFVNHRGAWVYSGLQADQAFATGQGVNLSQDLNWWDEDALPRIDKDYLFKACGVYWPGKNWVIWSVPMITSSGQSGQKTNNRLVVYDLNLGAWLPPFTIAVASMSGVFQTRDFAWIRH